MLDLKNLEEKLDNALAKETEESLNEFLSNSRVPEYVLCAAIWFQDGVKHEHQPKNIESGFVVSGRRHHNCYMTLAILKKEDVKRIDYGKNVQGFLTSKDRFIERDEAAKLALDRKQINREVKILFSEHLY